MSRKKLITTVHESIEIYDIISDRFREINNNDVSCLEETEQGYGRLISGIRNNYSNEQLLKIHEFNIKRYDIVMKGETPTLLTDKWIDRLPVEFKEHEKV